MLELGGQKALPAHFAGHVHRATRGNLNASEPPALDGTNHDPGGGCGPALTSHERRIPASEKVAAVAESLDTQCRVRMTKIKIARKIGEHTRSIW